MPEKHKASYPLEKAFGSGYTWKISDLKGGFSGASIYVAESDDKKVIVRFFDHLPSETKTLVRNNVVASEGGYGPKVYYHDEDEGVIVADFIVNTKVDPSTLHPDLAILLQKIHSGPDFESRATMWDYNAHELVELAQKKQSLIHVAEIKSKYDAVVQKILPHRMMKPCHRDLNPGNLIYHKGQFFAIDYDAAGMDDPFIDLAQLVLFYFPTVESERKFLSLYLGHEADEKDLEKLEDYKNIVRFFYGIGFSNAVPTEKWKTRPELMSFSDFFKGIGQGTGNLQDPVEQLRIGLILLRDAMA